MVAVVKVKAKDVVVKVRLVLEQRRRARAVVKAAPMQLLESVLLAHLHYTVPGDTVANNVFAKMQNR